MKKRIVILDFDGTITDAEAEGAPFTVGYIANVAALLGKKPGEVDSVIEVAEREIATNPGDNGWMYGGRIVAPATVDPYLRMKAIARRVFDHFSVFLDPNDRERILEFLYANNYHHSGIAFKEGADELLRTLFTSDQLVVYIVTNSHTEGVVKKVARLSWDEQSIGHMSSRVIGGAKKYVVDDQPDHVAESLNLTGLTRPVFLRRSAYFQVLERLCQEHDLSWENVTVIGDIFELDLALPFSLGARVGLIVNQFTPDYERDFILANPDRGRMIGSLSEVMPFVME